MEFPPGPGGDGVGGAADVPGGREDIENDAEKEEPICCEAGGRVALRRGHMVCERELGGRGDSGGGGGGRGKGEAVEDGEL